MLSSRAELDPFLKRPEYHNFLPSDGVLLIDGCRKRLHSLRATQVSSGSVSVQWTADRSALRTHQLQPEQRFEIGNLVRRAWLTRAIQLPGSGLMIIAHKAMFRKLTYCEVGPPSVLDLRGVLRRLDAMGNQ